MNCDTYLSMLATLPVEDLAYGGAREHAANCRDCDRVTRVVVERERNMAEAFSQLYSSVPAGPTATHALEISRRRRIASYFRVGLGVATAASIVLAIMISRLTPTRVQIATVSETFRLQCLSPEQAAEVLRPNRSPSVSVSIRPQSPLGIISVVAPPEEMERIRSVLDRYDTPSASQCGVKLTVPKDVRVP